MSSVGPIFTETELREYKHSLDEFFIDEQATVGLSVEQMYYLRVRCILCDLRHEELRVRTGTRRSYQAHARTHDEEKHSLPQILLASGPERGGQICSKCVASILSGETRCSASALEHPILSDAPSLSKRDLEAPERKEALSRPKLHLKAPERMDVSSPLQPQFQTPQRMKVFYRLSQQLQPMERTELMYQIHQEL